MQTTVHALLHRLKQNELVQFLILKHPQMCSFGGYHGTFNMTRKCFMQKVFHAKDLSSTLGFVKGDFVSFFLRLQWQAEF
jgi:hypothetical protein